MACMPRRRRVSQGKYIPTRLPPSLGNGRHSDHLLPFGGSPGPGGRAEEPLNRCYCEHPRAQIGASQRGDRLCGAQVGGCCGSIAWAAVICCIAISGVAINWCIPLFSFGGSSASEGGRRKAPSQPGPSSDYVRCFHRMQRRIVSYRGVPIIVLVL